MPMDQFYPFLVPLPISSHAVCRHLEPMLQVVCRALTDESQVVVNAALFALGQFSENLQVSPWLGAGKRAVFVFC